MTANPRYENSCGRRDSVHGRRVANNGTSRSAVPPAVTPGIVLAAWALYGIDFRAILPVSLDGLNYTTE